MTTYYISTTGKDSNPGTQSQPWLTLQYAQGNLHAGDTLMIADGTYNQDSNPNGFFYQKAIGSAGNPIIYQAVNPGQVIISNTLMTSDPSYACYNQGSYVNFTGIQFSTQGKFGMENAASHCTFTSCYFYDIPALVTGGGAIYLASGQTDNWMINCVVDNIGIGAGNNSLTQGIYMASSFGGIINCMVTRVGGYGLHMFHDATNCLVIFNLSLNNGTGGCINANDNSSNNNSVIANNILMNNAVYGLRENGNVGNNNTYSNNLFWGNGQGEWGSMVSTSPVVSSVFANPLFVNYTGDRTGNYALQAGSPAISAGLNPASYTPPVTTDVTGKARPQVGGYDIGAYEYGSNVYIVPPALWR